MGPCGSFMRVVWCGGETMGKSLSLDLISLWDLVQVSSMFDATSSSSLHNHSPQIWKIVVLTATLFLRVKNSNRFISFWEGMSANSATLRRLQDSNPVGAYLGL
ncbi:hypothetical protein CEXT_538581 [Caerostris extrusa]|uniref:Uncharacterized protein n=1 Tax=Caerostris extrusa TaxID=172846 RepID=A0AAV4SN43_CAEEX|nr:hypothetical protein CEXT_538581 [Caerostris extrusa]